MITSSAISALVLIPLLLCGLFAATMASIPVLLLLRLSSILLPFTSFSSSSSCHGDDDVDSSIQPYSPPTSSESVEAITERLFHFMGYPSLSDDGKSPSNYVDNMIHATDFSKTLNRHENPKLVVYTKKLCTSKLRWLKMHLDVNTE
jgi:hypothetical protein